MRHSKNLLELFQIFKRETELQLRYIQEENAEKFLESVEACEQLKEGINLFGKEDRSKEEQHQIDRILSDILETRKQISLVASKFQEKIKQNTEVENRKEILHKGYGNQNPHASSIFFDQKK